MHKICIMGLFFFSSLLAVLSGAETDNARDQVNKRLQEFIEGVNQHRVDQFASFWTPDARLTKPATGEVYNGRDQIAQYLQQRDQEIKERGLQFSFNPKSIIFPTPDQAVVEGVFDITEKGQLIQRNARRVVLLNQNGQWYIKEVREVEVAPPPPVADNLKVLEWLIGNWKDSDQDVTITFSAKWDKFKNFIIQNFKIETYGQEAMEGTQVIGWDPIKETIRSWVFDSDGGYGHGAWTKKDDSWNVAMHYVLSDGGIGRATNIYSNINDRSYRYASVERSIDEEPLDNIQPVTVRKE